MARLVRCDICNNEVKTHLSKEIKLYKPNKVLCFIEMSCRSYELCSDCYRKIVDFIDNM